MWHLRLLECGRFDQGGAGHTVIGGESVTHICYIKLVSCPENVAKQRVSIGKDRKRPEARSRNTSCERSLNVEVQILGQQTSLWRKSSSHISRSRVELAPVP